MKNVGLWIDHEKAFVIEMGSDTTKRLNALAEQSTSPVGSFDISPDNRVDRRRSGHLKTWYKEVMQELGRTYTGVGNVQLKAILRKVDGGERVVVYQTNNRNDAQIVAGRLTRAGAEVEVDG